MQGSILIFTCDEKELDFSKAACKEETLLYCLFGNKYKTAGIPEILKYIYEFLNSQNDFIKAYDKTGLASLITKFHRKRSEGNNLNFMGY